LALTSLGVLHTYRSARRRQRFWRWSRDKEISPKTGLADYLVATLITAVTGWHLPARRIGPPHALSILTLIALAWHRRRDDECLLGRLSRYVQAVSYSATMLFHMIPGFTES